MIQERLSMYDDLMENDPEMQRLRAKYKAEGLAEGLAEGKAEGKAEGLAEGLAEGKAETLRTTILTLIKVRFPTLIKQTRQRVTTVTDIDDLQDLFEQLASMTDEAAIRELLTSPIV